MQHELESGIELAVDKNHILLLNSSLDNAVES